MAQNGSQIVPNTKSIEFTAEEWAKLLSKERRPSKERIVVIARHGKILRINKPQWRKHFQGFKGIRFKRGKEIRIAPAASGGPKANIPDWVASQLAVESGDPLCISERDGAFYVKKLQLAERPTKVPGCTIIDTFGPTTVTRAFSLRPDPTRISHSSVRKLLPAVGKFRHDPVDALKHLNGRIGLLARKEFLGGWTSADKEAARAYRKALADGQQDDGSWHQSAAHTAFQLIRLIETGATLRYTPVAKAAEWLLSSSEPDGFPGLFMFDEEVTRRFNEWKSRHSGRDRGARQPAKGHVTTFIDNRDLLGVSNSFCELRLTWTSAVATEALLRCGLAAERRVIRALNTQLAMRHGMRWCGCGNFVAGIRHADSTDPLDFNSLPVVTKPPRGGAVWMIDWPVDPSQILEKVSDNPARGHLHYRHLSLGKNKAVLLRRPDKGSGDCSFIVHRGLSWHPAYKGSNLETLAALEWEYRQGWDGTWTGNALSFVFAGLERLSSPLGSFLVLRSLPALIRTQQPDGFWKEPDDVVRQGWALSRSPLPPPTKEETTFAILKALKKFKFLDTLIP